MSCLVSFPVSRLHHLQYTPISYYPVTETVIDYKKPLFDKKGRVEDCINASVSAYSVIINGQRIYSPTDFKCTTDKKYGECKELVNDLWSEFIAQLDKYLGKNNWTLYEGDGVDFVRVKARVDVTLTPDQESSDKRDIYYHEYYSKNCKAKAQYDRFKDQWNNWVTLKIDSLAEF